ncbi:serine hydrolase domain-containing protein [Streptomyces aurantiacus]|uniref:serine hydrolase domain-containing protein n=1 Tax=Streptomyces aurantiacus TaxID=47760 RepID=UPI000998912F|nr:serine hydrolase domain-containing protein [Streptomyces aurantiacus]
MCATVSPWSEVKPAYGYTCSSHTPERAVRTYSDGVADFATGCEFTPQTRVNCGSIGKLVTAYFVTRMWSKVADRERLRLGALLPGLPSPLADVSVESCLTHTTGLWDFRSLVPLFGERSTFVYGVSDVLELVVRQKELIPGFSRQYSNTNYLLLGVAVERQTGNSLQELVTEWLGSDVGNFVYSPQVVVPARARGYEIVGNGDVLEFGSFVDGRGSTNFWANTQELATLVARVTDGYVKQPAYGGLPLSDSTFYAAGQDGGFQAGVVVDSGKGRCHVALTNDPTLTTAQIMDERLGVRIAAAGGRSQVREEAAHGTDELQGTYTCASLGVRLSLVRDSGGALVVSTGDRVLGRLGRESQGIFSDGHLDIFQQGEQLFLCINHARGIPLERSAT